MRGDERIISDSVTIEEGRSERIVLDLPADEPDLAPARAATRATAPVMTSEPSTNEPWFAEERDTSGGGSWLVWTAVGVGVVGVAVLAVVLVSNSTKTKTEDPFAGDFNPPSLRVVVAP